MMSRPCSAAGFARLAAEAEREAERLLHAAAHWRSLAAEPPPAAADPPHPCRAAGHAQPCSAAGFARLAATSAAEGRADAAARWFHLAASHGSSADACDASRTERLLGYSAPIGVRVPAVTDGADENIQNAGAEGSAG